MDDVTTIPTADNTSRAVLISEVESRLQFNVFVSIFFCTLLYGFFRSLDKPDVDANKTLVHWATVPASYLLTYCFFEWGRSLIPKGWLKGIDVLLLVGTGLFVLPMILMAASEAKWFRIEVLLGVLSLWGVAVLASLLVVPVIAGICAGFYAGRREAIRSGLAWCRTKMEGGMSQRIFSFVAGAVFGLIAIGHLLRIAFNLSLVVQDFSVPMWASWIAFVVMAYLAYQAFGLARKAASGL